MFSLPAKIKSLYQATNRGLLKASDWIVHSLRIGLVFAVLLYAVGMGWFAFFAGKVSIDEHSVLVLDLKGALVEESSGGLRDKVIGEIQGTSSASVRLRDVAMALELAANDKRIDRVLLKLDDFKGAGLVSLREAAGAIEKFKASGKPVIAWSAAYDQRQYYLAAHANQVLVHPMGAVFIEGLGRQRNYYKDALDKLGINANLMRVGQYKSAGEAFVLNAPSAQALEAEAHVLDALWSVYTTGLEKARQLPAGSIAQNIEQLPGALQAVNGDAAQLVKNWKWVDGLSTYEALRDTLMKEVGADESIKSFRQVSLKSYLDAERKKVKGDHIAVVVAQGEIGDGTAPAGKIGGLSTSELIRKATEDDEVKAIVVRVNSPGGSVLGSELIRDQLRIAREKGKPVVVSMGDVAASGGYWIAMASDKVIADPATVTGSIGVFAMLPTGEGLMSKLGIHTGGYRTTWLAGAYDPRQTLDPRLQALVQSSIEHVYADFIGKAAQARQLKVSEVDELAQGRIWTGAQAHEHKLVDRLGNFNDAVDEARQLVTHAKGSATAGGKPLPIRYVSAKVSPFEAISQRFMTQLASLFGDSPMPWSSGALAAAPVTEAGLLALIGQDLVWLQDVLAQRQPFGAVAHCLCQVMP